jgi:hypothetical protein
MAEEDIIHYTISQIMALNHGEHLTSGPLHKLFESFPPPQFGFGPDEGYNNPYNHRFAGKKSDGKYRVKRAPALSDEAILDKLRSLFCGVTADGRKTTLTITKINQLIIPETQCDSIAKLFQDTMIECEFLMDEYLKILLTFRSRNGIEKEIRRKFISMVLKELKNPSTFEDSRIEEGLVKNQRWRRTNCVIIAKLAIYPYLPVLKDIKSQFSVDNIYKRFINHLFSNVDKDSNDITNIAAVWQILEKKREFKEDPRYDVYRKKMGDIFEDPDKKYPKLLKIKLLDYID